ncbi:MAG: tyrosine-protein phosphatase [Candidatus Obscuribacterales bacterium]|nr:tyrosine-protein phosphatase [Candidatus Obscuribacterales bacterium]
MYKSVRRNARFWLPILLGFALGATNLPFAWSANETALPEGTPIVATQKLNLATLKSANSEIKNLHVVSQDLVRGAQPSYKGLVLLKQAGVKTIVNLRNEEKWMKSEKELTRKLGLKYVSIPLNSFNQIPQEAIDQFLRQALGPASQPVFVHCMLGEDRTGLMCASYRMHHDGWSTQKAFEEAVAYGFKPFLLPLVDAIWGYGQILGHDEPMPSMSYVYDDLRQRINSKMGPLLGSKYKL